MSAITPIADRLRARRLAQGLTQQAVANRVGIARAYYGRIEKGQQRCSLDTLCAIGDALGMTYGELFGVDESPPRDETDRTIDADGELEVPPPERWMSVSLRAETPSAALEVKAGDVLIFEGEDDPKPGQLVLARRGRTWRVGRYQAKPAPSLEPWSPDGDVVLLDARWEVMAVAVRLWREL